MRTTVTASLLAALLAALAPALRAEEPASEVKAFVDKIEELRKAADESGLKGELKKAVDLHNGLTDPAAKSAVQDAIGKVLKDKKSGDARIAATVSLAALNDHKGAWKHLKAVLPDKKLEAAEPIDLAVLDAVGKVADEGAIPPLLELAESAKDKAIARDAAQALAGFTGAGKKRVVILEGLMSIAVKIKPSAGTKGVSQEAQARWSDVGNAIGKTFNVLTGRNIATWEEIEVLWKDNKKTPAKLFSDGG